MDNPFKPGDRVLTRVKSLVVNATVRLVWNDEVQVRTSDSALRWRTARTVWLPAEPADAQKPAEIAGPASSNTVGTQNEREAQETPASAPEALVPPQTAPCPETPIQMLPSAHEVTSCGAREEMEDRKRDRKRSSRRRR